MLESLTILYNYRELLWIWTLREIKVRYKQSILGCAWAVLQPLSLMLIFTAVFGYFVKVPTDGIPYPVFSYTALLPWTFFATSINFAAPSLVNNMNLVTKIYFPREIFPIASIGAAFLDYLIASSLFVILLVAYQMPFHGTMLLLPLLLLVQISLTTGICLLSAAVTALYRDFRFVIPLGLQLFMYVTPVVYPLSAVPERFRNFYMLNPMAALIDSYRRISLLGAAPDWSALVLCSGLAVVILAAGHTYFRRVEPEFADVI